MSRIMLRIIVAAATSRQRAKLKFLLGILEALTRIAPKFEIRQATVKSSGLARSLYQVTQDRLTAESCVSLVSQWRRGSGSTCTVCS